VSMLDLIRPYDVGGELIRYGRKSDGGYIVNKKYIDISNVLYTYGVGDDISFEIDLFNNNQNYKIHLYDHTTQNFQDIHENIVRHSEGLSLEKEENCDNFLNHLSMNKEIMNNILLKIDIEGYEIDFFNKIDLSKFDNVVQMLLEFHIEEDKPLQTSSYLKKAIENINNYFYPIHIHGNNHRDLLHIDGQEFPLVSELTFINKRFIKDNVSRVKKVYPIPNLDFRNGGEHKDWGASFK